MYSLGFLTIYICKISPRSFCTTIVELGPQRPSLLWFWELNSTIVVYVGPLDKVSTCPNPILNIHTSFDSPYRNPYDSLQSNRRSNPRAAAFEVRSLVATPTRMRCEWPAGSVVRPPTPPPTPLRVLMVKGSGFRVSRSRGLNQWTLKL